MDTDTQNTDSKTVTNVDNVLSRTISIWSDTIDDELDDELHPNHHNSSNEDALFELPLKSNYFHNTNFAQLSNSFDDDDSTSILATNNKKVRFIDSQKGHANHSRSVDDLSNDGDDENDLLDNPNSSRKGTPIDDFIKRPNSSCTNSMLSTPVSRKRNIEELLQYSSQVNDFLSHNMDRIDKLRAEVFTNDGLYRPLSDVATQTTSPMDYISNFELSDKELSINGNANLLNNNSKSGNTEGDLDLQSNITKEMNDPTEDISDRNDLANLLKDPNKFNLSTTSFLSSSGRNTPTPSRQQSQIMGGSSSQDLLVSSKSPSPLSSISFLNQLNEQILNFKDLNISNIRDEQLRNENKAASVSNSEIPMIYKKYKDSISNEAPTIDEEASINMFHDSISCIFELSKKQENLTDDNNGTSHLASNINQYKINTDENDEFNNFKMKSTPTLSFGEFIKRIQSKCMFGPIVYLSASYLLQILLLTRDGENGALKLKIILHENEIHRLIIATIRIATKLIEDSVHSHLYMSKVCGVSKKLLLKIEISLLMCIVDENIVITCKHLNVPRFVLDELKSMVMPPDQ
ncbi:hypothetical protein TBLA_0A02100 [Henningerozyma blattae CBS 6284]|uniref:Uncharacterized protein n=1 Tax=Henningerozyma blattae (strain ATCC 34711 / CBS 6284 / DSM 70876 / NBRC 10599 / NRRL Y-10934 / UCD 77-7) TaxID=1071380 RepID=I2GV59_HENB6|nr:hypothetical protein TBLA_0A02100 [Tetrapisispora blattae CBS 6284]CCH58011.1 hypothetical protein TBLA_0A02100 [Tetrapisispora blattae CBS 6284]